MEHHNNRNKLEDEAALRDLMAKYTDAVNRYNPDSWISCWTEDAVWDLMGTKVTGKANILGLWQQVMSGLEFAVLMPSSCLFSIDGDTATGHWYLHEYTRDKTGKATTILSMYKDKYRKVDGQWHYEVRGYEFIYNGDPNLTGQYTQVQ